MYILMIFYGIFSSADWKVHGLGLGQQNTPDYDFWDFQKNLEGTIKSYHKLLSS